LLELMLANVRVDLIQPNRFVHKVQERRKSPVDIEEMKKEMQFLVYLQEKYYNKAIRKQI